MSRQNLLSDLLSGLGETGSSWYLIAQQGVLRLPTAPPKHRSPQVLYLQGLGRWKRKKPARYGLAFLSTPQRIRTSNLRFRRPMLYPIELGVQVVSCKAFTSFFCGPPILTVTPATVRRTLSIYV